MLVLMLLHVGAAQRVLILRRVIIAVLDAHIPGLLLLPDGTVRGAGMNYKGELGDGTNTDRNTFVQAKNISG